MSIDASGLALRALSKMICGDVEAGTAGITPSERDLHAEVFSAYDGKGKFEDVSGKAFDRLVQIAYEGTPRWAGVWNRGQLERTMRAVIRIGYLVGDHEELTDRAIADDEHKIAKHIRKDSNWPSECFTTLGGFVPKSSSLTKIEPDRKINEIAVEVTVTE